MKIPLFEPKLRIPLSEPNFPCLNRNLEIPLSAPKLRNSLVRTETWLFKFFYINSPNIEFSDWFYLFPLGRDTKYPLQKLDRSIGIFIRKQIHINILFRIFQLPWKNVCTDLPWKMCTLIAKIVPKIPQISSKYSIIPQIVKIPILNQIPYKTSLDYY